MAGCESCLKTRFEQTSFKSPDGKDVPAMTVCFSQGAIDQQGGIKGLLELFNRKPGAGRTSPVLLQVDTGECDNTSSYQGGEK